MTLDLRSRNFDVTVYVLNSAGTTTATVDITDAVVSLQVDLAQASDSGCLLFSGDLSISAQSGGSFSTNPRNASGSSPQGQDIWKRGNRVRIRIADEVGTLREVPTRLFITETPAPPYPTFGGENLMAVALACELSLLDYRTPEGDESGITFGTISTINSIIASLLNAADAPGWADSISGVIRGAGGLKTDSRSYIQQAGEFARSRGNWIWANNAGNTKQASPNYTGGALAFSITVGEVEVVFEPSDEGAPAPQKVRVIGTAMTAAATSYPIRTRVESTGPDGAIVKIEDTVEDVGSNARTLDKTIYLPASASDPDGSDIVLILSETSAEEWEYREGGGSLTAPAPNMLSRYSRTVRKTRGLISDALSEILPRSLRTALTEVRTYSYTDEELSRVVTLIQEPKAAIEPDNDSTTLRPSVYSVETWRRYGDQDYLYVRDYLVPRARISTTNPADGEEDDRPFKLVPDPQNSISARNNAGQNNPPAPELYPDEVNYEEETFEGVATVTPGSGSPYREKELVITAPAGMVNSQIDATLYAVQEARILQGRQWAVRVGLPLLDWFLTDFQPLSNFDLTVDGVTTRYVLDGVSIRLDGQTCDVEIGGFEIGVVSESVATPRYSVTESIQVLDGEAAAYLATNDGVFARDVIIEILDGEAAAYLATDEASLAVTILCTGDCAIGGKALAFGPGWNGTHTFTMAPEPTLVVADPKGIEIYGWTEEPNTGLSGRVWVADLPETGGTFEITFTGANNWISVFARDNFGTGDYNGACITWDNGTETITIEGFA